MQSAQRRVKNCFHLVTWNLHCQTQSADKPDGFQQMSGYTEKKKMLVYPLLKKKKTVLLALIKCLVATGE